MSTSFKWLPTSCEWVFSAAFTFSCH
jgi:hypothetical protein